MLRRCPVEGCLAFCVTNRLLCNAHITEWLTSREWWRIAKRLDGRREFVHVRAAFNDFVRRINAERRNK